MRRRELLTNTARFVENILNIFYCFVSQAADVVLNLELLAIYAELWLWIDTINKFIRITLLVQNMCDCTCFHFLLLNVEFTWNKVSCEGSYVLVERIFF